MNSLLNIIDILACPTCAKAFQETQGDAAGYAILFMVCIIMPIATAVIICFVRIALRQKRADTGEYDDPFLETLKAQARGEISRS